MVLVKKLFCGCLGNICGDFGMVEFMFNVNCLGRKVCKLELSVIGERLVIVVGDKLVIVVCLGKTLWRALEYPAL
jgi:hypothetical protein